MLKGNVDTDLALRHKMSSVAGNVNINAYQNAEEQMKPITSEQDRQERIAQVKRQLGNPRTSPMKRRDLQKYLTKLQFAKVKCASETYTQDLSQTITQTITEEV